MTCGAWRLVSSYPRPAELVRYGAAGPFRTDTRAGRLHNVGWAQAQFNLTTMSEAGYLSPMVWVDVEPVTGWPWSSNRSQNRAVVSGIIDGYHKAGLKTGIYSTQSLWAGIVGSTRFESCPEWRTAGGRGKVECELICAASPPASRAGLLVLAQWWRGERDLDVACPGHRTTAAMRTYFHRY